MSKWGTCEIIPPNSVLAQATWLILSLPPTKKPKMNIMLGSIFRSLAPLEPKLPSHSTPQASSSHDWELQDKNLHPAPNNHWWFQTQIKFSFIKSDYRQDLFLIFNCQNFTVDLKRIFFNDSFAKGKSGIHNNFWSLQPWTLQRLFLEKSFNAGMFLTEGSLRIEGFPGSIFLFPLIYSSPLEVSPIKMNLHWHHTTASCSSGMSCWVIPSPCKPLTFWDESQALGIKPGWIPECAESTGAGWAPQPHFFCCVL